MVPIRCDPQEVQLVKDALTQDPLDGGVGILHEPTGEIYLSPINSLPNRSGHVELAQIINLPLSECKGFVIARTNGGFRAVNMSQLNGPQGQPGSLQMPQSTFDDIVKALTAAGL
jgi:hypothetical protein